MNAFQELAQRVVTAFRTEGAALKTAAGNELALVEEDVRTLEDELAKGADADMARLAHVLVKNLPTEEPAVDGLPRTGTHRTWKNQTGNQVVQPLQYFRPTGLDGDDQAVTSILRLALAQGRKVKAAGSGHSYSSVATTPDLFVDTHGLDRLASADTKIAGQLDPTWVRGDLPLLLGNAPWPSNVFDPKNRAMVEMECGIKLQDLVRTLEGRDLGLLNMGGYAGQTIMGVISTSTHGSGITLGPFSDMVRSLVLATTGRWKGTTTGGAEPTDGVYLYRIEPTQGITDPAKYQDPRVQLIQDDAAFQAAICSMGCFGIVYSVVIEVMQMYWLRETRFLSTLDKVKEMWTANPDNPFAYPDAIKGTRNIEVLVHAYPMEDGKVVEMDLSAPPGQYDPLFECLVTERNFAQKPPGIIPRKGGRNWIVQLLGSLNLPFELLVQLLNAFPELIPSTISTSLKGLVDTGYVNKYYEIFDLGLAPDSGFAAEIGFVLSENERWTSTHFEAAIDRIHRIGQIARVTGRQYQTSAFSIRWVKGSQASLSMMEGVDTCMIEMDMVTGTYGGAEIMMRYEESMYALGGRPHWGLEFDHLNGSNGLVGQLYPRLPEWKAVYDQFNALGTFDNRFTERMGFTRFDFKR